MSELNDSTANQPLRIYSGGRRVTSFDQINEHHSGSRYQTATVNGREERVRSDGRVDGGVAGVDSSGVRRVVKDIVLRDSSGSTAVNVPAAVSGTLKLTPASESGGYGNMAEILNSQGQVIARFGHLASFNPALQSGQAITAGTSLGIQGSTGHSSGTHLHAELRPSDWASYVESLTSGRFSQTQAVQPSTSSSSTNQPLQVYSGGTRVTEFSQINEHHNGSRYQTATVNGREERVRSDGRVDGGVAGVDSSGVVRVVKDIVLADSTGNTAVNVPAAISGTLKLTPASESGGYGNMAEILNSQGQVVARFGHLASFNPALQSGQAITAGTSLGIQGTTGHSTGVHLHVELPASEWTRYMASLNSGQFTQSQTGTSSSSGTGHQTATTGTAAENNSCNYQMVAALIKASATEMKKLGLDVVGSSTDLDTAIMAYAKINKIDSESLLQQSPNYQALSSTDAATYRNTVVGKADAVVSAMTTPTVQQAVR
jgi:murein DD-endopeptidase MepM/ murein hydrolase activator NlpD